ncbi:hypothetical protein [Arabidopsis thaliana]|uniref:Uncharacterized protein AT4g17310 n=1 Tax=Arabidopsis thaliana TaxID=3702 RepID=O23574_ARATH|nr:hypothetical protein [Arabidopsis thaliana]CAB78734.1 hypothetical protein [Arabidopsis thaliana]
MASACHQPPDLRRLRHQPDFVFLLNPLAISPSPVAVTAAQHGGGGEADVMSKHNFKE